MALWRKCEKLGGSGCNDQFVFRLLQSNWPAAPDPIFAELASIFRKTSGLADTYAIIVEEEYQRAAKLPTYQILFAEIDLASAAEAVHIDNDPAHFAGGGATKAIRRRANCASALLPLFSAYCACTPSHASKGRRQP